MAGELLHTQSVAGDNGDEVFRAVAQSLSTPCWISDAEGAITWVNAAWVAYTGLDVEAIQSQGLESLHDPNILPDVRRRWDAAKARGLAEEMVFPLRGRDGKLRPFLTRVVPLPDSAGKITRWFGTNTDISEQAEAQTRLGESQTRLELATRAAELGVWDWDLATNAFVYSPRAREICGFPLEGEISYDDVVRATHPEDYPWTSQQARRAMDPDEQDHAPYQYRVIRSDGEVRWVLAHGEAVFAGVGAERRAIRYVGTLQDITDRVRLENTLHEQDALLRSLFDASELFISVVEITDDSYVYLVLNKAMTAFYGLRDGAENVDARSTSLTAEEIARWRQTMLDVASSGAPRTMEYPFSCNGVVTGWYVGTFAPQPPGPSGRPRVSFVVIDISARKFAEERQTLLMREVDHRAKNALAVVQAIVQLTRDDDFKGFKTAVQGRVTSLARVHTLLAAERWEGADLKRLVSEELAPFRAERGARITIEGPPYSLEPQAAQSMALVIHELATNAAKHGSLSSVEGELRVRWSVDAGALSLTWTEAGVNAVAPTRRGFGFTLLEQSVRRQLGGECTLEWKSTGLVCSIVLPSQHKVDVVAESDAASELTDAVLLVEDEPLIALALEQDLMALGYTEIAKATTISQALALVAQTKFALGILDFNLAGETTIEVAMRLAERATPLVFCTGYEAINLPPALVGLPRLVKPVTLPALKQAIQGAGERDA